MANESLGSAKKAKNDEFYTQFHDTEKEINAYLEYNPNVFQDKTILLPCDDPEWSNFTKYFAQNFQTFRLKRLISTSLAPQSKQLDVAYQPTLFELESPEFDSSKSEVNGKIFSLTRDKTGDGVIDVNDLEWEYLEGDGDFRSNEIRKLRNEVDIIITNPPFSLFREFLTWLVESKKTFLIIGNMNAITYKEVFPLIKDNQMWLGSNAGGASMSFILHDNSPAKSGQKEVDGVKIQQFGNICWYTNVDHGRRHEPIRLMTMQDNGKFNKKISESGYKKYDNYDAIEVPKVDAIPSDFNGVMGVPITFLSKYNPEQFEIIGNTEGFEGTPPTKIYAKKERVVDGNRVKSNTGTMSGVIRREEFGAGTYFDVGYPVQAVYKRILIRHKSAGEVTSGNRDTDKC
jgi:hypothetical protein